MQKESVFKFTTSTLTYPILFVLIIWIVFWVEIRFGYNFTKYGVKPNSFEGLKGIILSPFIHSNTNHLTNNSLPLFVLSLALFYFYRTIAWKVIFYGILLSGFITWCIARPSYHIGASGLVYLLFSFIFFKGILAKHYRLIALSLVVVFLYGSMLMYIFPIKEGISWEGHTAGFISGLVFAILFKKTIPKPAKYHWEDPNYNEENDLFMKHFDKDGNFIENALLQQEEE